MKTYIRALIIFNLVIISMLGYQSTIYAGELIYIKNDGARAVYRKDDGSYAKSEWIEWKYESGGSKWRYFNRFGDVVSRCYFEVNGKLYYADIGGELAMNRRVSRYYADETGALRETAGGRYVNPRSLNLKKSIFDVEGLPGRVEENYSSDYQLLSEYILNKEDGRKAAYIYEYDSNGNMVKLKAMEGENKLLYTLEYAYDGKNMIKKEFKDANGNVKLTRLIHYNAEDHVDEDEFLSADGSSIVKYKDGWFYSGSIQTARDELKQFIKDTCPEGSIPYESHQGLSSPY